MQTNQSKSRMENDLKSLPMPEPQAKLVSSPDGLSQAEVKRRLVQYGYNEISEKRSIRLLSFSAIFGVPFPG